MEARSTNYHAQALTRGIALLRELAQATEPMGLGDLHRATELPRSTVIRLLAALEADDLVVRIGERDATYALGHGVLTLAAGYRRTVDAEALARPILTAVARDTAHTTNLGVLVGRSVLHVCVAEPDRPIRFRSTSGSTDHAHCTGLGKMLLSQLPEGQRARHLPAEPFPSFTPHTFTTFAALDAELATIAVRGYSIDAEERDMGVRCLAVPVFPQLPDGDAPVALSVSGPSGELVGESEQRVLETLRAAAAEIRANESLVHALRVTAGVPGLISELRLP